MLSSSLLISGGLRNRIALASSRSIAAAALPANQLALGSTTSMVAAAVDAWSVAERGGAALNSPDLASNFFAVSLFPWLAFLYFLSRPEVKTPPLANFGFQFLLVFVFATIPAGIVAKVYYHDILANVDLLHGAAESFLTLTNLFIIQGFRNSRPQPPSVVAPTSTSAGEANTNMNDLGPAALITTQIALGAATLGPLLVHAEPANALSLPTWFVHTSSLIEWLVAMKLVWEHADTTGNPRWRGLPWAMILSHTSGVCACTYHLFYNSPDLNWIVNLQAALTAIGNTALAFAAYRVYAYENKATTKTSASASASASVNPLSESDTEFWVATTGKALIFAALVKYGELFFDFPFEANSIVAASVIALPVVLNVSKWYSRSSALAQNRPESAN